jgi:sec-independent protein translocase protein TatC
MSTAVPDPEDFFADTRMSFGDHIEDLRTHLWRAIKGFGVALVFSFFIGHYVLGYITLPVKQQLEQFHANRVKDIENQLPTDRDLQALNTPTPFTPYLFYRPQIEALVKGTPADKINGMPRPKLKSPADKPAEEKGLFDRIFSFWGGDNKEPENANEVPIKESDVVRLWVSVGEPVSQSAGMNRALRTVNDSGSLISLRLEEPMMVWFKVCLVCGLVLGSPWIFWQIWSFVGAGLYPHEKRLVHVYLPISLGLFLAGVVVCELFVIPKAIEALLWFNDWLGYKPELRLSDWMGFAIFMPVIFGLSFQTPLVMLFMAKIGIVDVQSFRNKRKLFWFLMAVFAAVITPSTDAFSMLFLWVPMSLLFELGILLIKLSPRASGLETEESESEELVEV